VTTFSKQAVEGNAVDGPALIDQAITTENLYFELAAERLKLAGATLAWMPGLAAIPAAAVIHRVDPDAIASSGKRWLVEAEGAFTDAGARTARIYIDRRNPAAEQALAGAGYRCREELVFAGSLAGAGPEVTLRRLESHDDWQRKQLFHRQAGCNADGHANEADAWVELERRKSAAGMHAYLAEAGGEIVGAVGAIRHHHILRFKNLVVHPGQRRKAIAQSMLDALAEIGRQSGASCQVALAVGGELGERLYRSLGLTIIGSRFEWSKRLSRSEQ
jgi:ribosomal protein S18 acetylase RimI-like enzyme